MTALRRRGESAIRGRRRPEAHGQLSDRSRTRLWFILGISGWAFAIVVWIVGWQIGVFRISGDVAEIFLPAGRAFWSGANPYSSALSLTSLPFLYAPPWAAAFGIVSPFGPAAVHALLSGLELLALRYMGGSWIRAGAFCWFLLVPWEIAAGQMNLLVAAAIVAAVRGRTWPAAVMAQAKLSPVLAVRPRDWRPFLIAALLFCAISLPRLDLWAAWAAELVSVAGAQPGPLVPVPLVVRLPVGFALALMGRPWSRALGAAVALPGLYWGALVVFVAPFAVAIAPRHVDRNDEGGDGSGMYGDRLQPANFPRTVRLCMARGGPTDADRNRS